jgi:uncharacterized membrane protein
LTSVRDGILKAVRWDPNGRIVDLRPGDPGSSQASAVNNAGTVVGRVGPHAARWDRNGRYTDLGTLPGGIVSVATAVYDNGLILGTADGRGLGRHAVTWDAAGRIRDLGLVSGSFFGDVHAAGSVGGLVGQSAVGSHVFAVRWNAGRITAVPELTPTSRSNATAIRGWTAYGTSEVGTDKPHIVSWDRQNRLTDFGTLPGGTFSNLVSVGPDGTVIGYGDTADGRSHAVVWLPATACAPPPRTR